MVAPLRLRAYALVAALAVAAPVGGALGGCRDAPPAEAAEAPPPPPPAVQVAHDLVGHPFAFYEDEQGEKTWTIEEGEVQDLRVLDGATSSDGTSHRTRVRLRLVSEYRTIRGDLTLTYRQADGGWALDEVARTDGRNWTVEELAAVVYEVRRPAPSDTTAGERDVWLEPMFRYVDGEFVSPFDPYEARITALLDSSFSADSLRRAAVAGLEREIGRRWLNPAWTVFLLQPGQPPAPVTFRTRETSVDGCRYVAGLARAPSASFAEGAHVATSSSTMGGSTFPGRTLEPGDEERLAHAARAVLARAGVPERQLDRLRSRRALAVDLDGGGREALVGAYSVAADPAGGTDRAVVVVAGPGSGALRDHGAYLSDAADGWGALQLIGALDVDGDGVLEVIARESAEEAYRYVVLARDASGRWAPVFTGGGGGC